MAQGDAALEDRAWARSVTCSSAAPARCGSGRAGACSSRSQERRHSASSLTSMCGDSTKTARDASGRPTSQQAFVNSAPPRPPTHALEAAGYRLMHDRQDVLWVGTFGDGLWRVRSADQEASIERAALRTGLSSDSVLSIMEDRDGNVWVGTTVGLHRLTKRALTPLEDVGFVLTVQPWRSDGVLAGTTKGLVRVDADRRPDGGRSTSDRQRQRYARSFATTSGTLWIGAADGLWRLVDGRVVHEDLGTRVGHAGALDLTGRRRRTLARRRPVGLSLERRNSGSADASARRRLRRPSRSLAPIPATSLARLGQDRSASLTPDGTLPRAGPERTASPRARTSTLYDVFEDSDGVVWLGTSSGLSRFANGRVTSVGSAQGLPGDRVWSIVQDSDRRSAGSASIAGSCASSRSDIALAMASPSRRMPYQMYDPKDGLAGAPLGTINSAREAERPALVRPRRRRHRSRSQRADAANGTAGHPHRGSDRQRSPAGPQSSTASRPERGASKSASRC